MLALLGLNKELRDTLNELERYCLVSSVYISSARHDCIYPASSSQDAHICRSFATRTNIFNSTIASACRD